MALLLFDPVGDQCAPAVTCLKVQDLLNAYRDSATPKGQPEFVKMLPRETVGDAQPGELKLEVGQHLNDRVRVINVPKHLLWQILPYADEVALLGHVRTGRDSADPSKEAEYPVIICN